jgi:hypothetical protein
VQQIHAVEHRRAAFDAAGRLRDQPHERVAGDRFARARFADDAEGFAALEREAHSVDGAVDARAGVKIGPKILDGQERQGGRKGMREAERE